MISQKFSWIFRFRGFFNFVDFSISRIFDFSISRIFRFRAFFDFPDFLDSPEALWDHMKVAWWRLSWLREEGVGASVASGGGV